MSKKIVFLNAGAVGKRVFAERYMQEHGAEVRRLVRSAAPAHDSKHFLAKSAGMPPAIQPPAPPVAAIHAPVAGRRAGRVTNPAALHQATGPAATSNFTHEEMSGPSSSSVRQRTKNADELYGHAGKHKEWLDNTIDRGKGVGAQFGMHIVEGRIPTPEDYAEGHRKGGMVVMAPLKGMPRFEEKVNGKYGGDASRVRDLSRATIAVRHPDDLPHVTHALRKMGMRYAAAPEDRFQNPTDAGYADVQTAPQDPQGHVGELQLHTLDHLEAKEHGIGGEVAGHKMYERLRTLGETKRDLTDDEKTEYEGLNQRSRALYTAATARMHARTPAFAQKKLSKALKGFRKMGSTEGHPLRPGFYNWGGTPALRTSHAGRPKSFNGHTWNFVPDIGKFDHEAHRITKAEFDKMMKHATSR